MMSEVEAGDILQLNPDHEFGAETFLVVTEPKEWGAQGYILSPYIIENLVRYKGKAYLRVKNGEFEKVGRLTWIRKDEEDES